MSSSSKLYQSASKAARSLLSAVSQAQRSSSSSVLTAEGRNAALATLTNLGRKTLPTVYSYHKAGGSHRHAHGWGWLAAVPAAVYMLQDQEAHAAEMERTFIAIKPDGVQRGLISEIVSRFERKGYKLVAIKLIVPSKEFAQKHYHDLKDRPFFNGLCDFLSSGPVLAMVWEGEGVIKYGRKLIGATDPQKSEPGTIRGDLAVVVGRNIIHGSDGPETAKDEIALWFEPKELVSYTSNTEKWIYGVN
ncbi:nucleoside diphosphate kinase 3-like [Phragmites australis]|uniref:nucleoside diphosphate kinase 3-like n=1 Tax=Phragmites australis TaxID=29695 RepID=UPI002D79DB19|nr:nucleoside diphosphate kinase 3-like [Phragmites australis]